MFRVGQSCISRAFVARGDGTTSLCYPGTLCWPNLVGPTCFGVVGAALSTLDASQFQARESRYPMGDAET